MAEHKTILTGGNETVSIRKISNGWIVSTTVETKGKKGMTDFKTTETYSAEKPKVEIS